MRGYEKMNNANLLNSLLDNLTAFAANGTGSPEQINAFGFEIRGLEHGARVATVKLAIGCLRRYANGDKQKFFASGDDQRLKNYYSVFNGLVSEGYAPATQLAWFSKVEGNFSAVYGQSKKAAIAALQEAGILEKPATPAPAAAGAPAAGAPAAGEITAKLSEADRAGTIAAELVGTMSPEVFDLLAAAVAKRTESDKAAQQRRDAAAAKRQAAADIAAAAKAAQEKADKDAAHIAELRRAADAADLAAVAADQEAKKPNATAATKKRAAKLLKAAQAAGGAYLAAAGAAHQAAIAA